MRLSLKPSWLAILVEAGDPAARAAIGGAILDQQDVRIALEASQCALEALRDLHRHLDSANDASLDAEDLLLHQQLSCWIEVEDFKGPKITNLTHLVLQLVAYLKEGNQLLLREDATGALVPWYVSGIRVAKGKPPYITVRLEASVRGRRTGADVVFFGRDLMASVAKILAHRGCYRVGSTGADCTYQITEAARISARVGLQVIVAGPCLTVDGKSAMIAAPERAVVDASRAGEPDFSKIGELPAVVSAAFWGSPKMVRPPVQPYIRVFSLDRHTAYLVHVDRLREHVYDKDALDQVVVPRRARELLTALVEADVRAYRTACSLVIFRGPPGTGKTRSAEAYAECARRPLYRVHCSQLGTSEIELEARLEEVLIRAEAWNAVVLIDEADVYVRPRTDDIKQNAIVGVFLRLLDKHTSLVFLTTNRTDLDAAITSRALVVFDYKLPTEEERVQIVQQHAAAMKLELSPEEARWLAASKPDSGRALERMLCLTRLVHGCGGPNSPFQTPISTLRFLVSPVEDVAGAGGGV